MADEKKPGMFGRFFGGKQSVIPDAREERDPGHSSETEPPVIIRPGVEDAAESDALAPEVELPREKTGWFARLTKGLSRTSEKLGAGITDLFTKSKFDAATLEELEDLLIQADLGVDAAARIAAEVGRRRQERGLDGDGVRRVVAGEVEKALADVARPLVVTGAKPFVILMAGVNGSGKTTTIGKLAQKFKAEGKSVMLAAGDTFRAAAVEQLNIWAERVGVPIVTKDIGADASGLAYEAVEKAHAANVDVLIIDTAGRLQNRAELMQELEKIARVIRKVDADAPHAALLVLDATVGQNALSQVELFQKTAGITGLVMTKLDGTARGGILVAVAEKFGLPIHFIGIGEGVNDLEPFDAKEFSHALVGLDKE
jgi:fused signal recognition particle receptor